MSVAETLKQSLPFIILCGIGDVAAGVLLARSTNSLELMPGLIVMIPALIGLRGNLGTTLGCRLSSAAHMGLISEKRLFNDEMRENLKAQAISILVIYSLVGVLGYVTTASLGLPAASFWKLVAIALITGATAGVAMVILTIGIIILTFKRGLDPDNVVGPSLSSVGDFVTLLCVLMAVYIVGGGFL